MPQPQNADKRFNHLSRNEQFLRKVGEIVESNLSNEHFGVENLAEAMAMSRIHLYRKLHKLTGKNISQYIREFRLERALGLLKEDVAIISEIAYQVGFSSPSYFNKCFHDHFGYPPGKVIKRQGGVADESLIQDETLETDRDPKKYNKRIFFYLPAFILLIFIIAYFVIKKGNIGLKPIKEKSIAVLPFHNDSPYPDNAYICRGIEEELRNQLLSINDLEIIGRQEVEKYNEEADKELAVIGSELNVSYIITGSVRKVEDDIRIIVQLYDTKTGDLLWGNAYDGKYNDALFLFQSNIATQIASAVNAVITPEEVQQLTKPPTISITAYDYILRARDEQWKFWFFEDTVAEKNAERLYDKALKLDPNYARGWACKGSIYYDLHVQSEEYYEENYLDSVLWYCEKASRIDPESPDSYNMKAMVYHKKGDIKSAIHNYDRAIKNSSGNKGDIKQPMWRLGYIYVYNKEYKKGISLIRRAVQEAKDSPRDYAYLLYRLAYAYLWMGDYEEAENYYLQSMDMGGWYLASCYFYYYRGDFQGALDCSRSCSSDPDDKDYCLYFLGNTYFQLGDFENAVKYYRQFREIREAGGLIQWNNLYREGIALIELGKKEEGVRLIEEQLSQLVKRKKLGRADGYDYHLAAIAAYREDPEKAIQYLRDYEKKVFFQDHKIIPLYFAQYDILFKPLWNNSEFKALLKQEQDEKEAGRAQVRALVESGKIVQ